MNLLTGEYQNTLDDKGRILFPSKLKAALSEETLIVTQGIDHCLWLYTPDEWQKLESKLDGSASLFKAQNRLVYRHLIGPAVEISFDKAGRLSIPQSLREYASLEKDCILLGINRLVELWDAESYRKYLAESEASFKEAAEALSDIM